MRGGLLSWCWLNLRVVLGLETCLHLSRTRSNLLVIEEKIDQGSGEKTQEEQNENWPTPGKLFCHGLTIPT